MSQVGGVGNAAIAVSLTVMSRRQSHASNNTSLFLARWVAVGEGVGVGVGVGVGIGVGVEVVYQIGLLRSLLSTLTRLDKRTKCETHGIDSYSERKLD